MSKYIAIALGCFLAIAGCLYPKGGDAKLPDVIGGLQYGTAGTGIYGGYSLAGGDRFDGLLSVFHADDPYARYIQTHIYYAGSRSIANALINSYDSDPWHTGAQDANRGVPVGTNDTLVQNNGLILRARSANAQELPLINGRKLVSGMISSAPYLTFVPPAIVEAYIKFNVTAAGAPIIWHPTFWVQSASPIDSCDSCASPGGQEYDFPEIGCTACVMRTHMITHGTTPTVANATADGPALPSTLMGDGNYHLYTLVLTATGTTGYVDGTAYYTSHGQDATISNRPYQIFLTNHTYATTQAQQTSLDITTWNNLGTDGAYMQVAWYRVWVPTASTLQVERPIAKLPTLKVNWNTALSYTFPSAAAIWGQAINDYPQAVRFEDSEPGSTGEGATAYQRFPAELTYNTSTRVLSGTVTSRPGRLHLMSVPNVSGGSLGYSARGYIDVGPHVKISSLPGGTNGTTYASYDLYAQCDVGTLLPKTITVSGLPSGMNFNASTGLITGTPATAGSYSVTVNVTNSSGQVSSKVLTLAIA